MIADSCFIIDLMRESKPALKKLTEINEQSQGHYITTPTVMELAIGVALAGLPKKEQKRIDGILAGFQVIPFDAFSAWRAGLEMGRLRKTGKIVDPIDGQIAGIALHHGESIVTRNVKHFQLFKGLKVESY